MAPLWLQEPDVRARHARLRTTIARAIAWVEAAIRGHLPVGVVVCAAWALAEDVMQVLARRRQDGIRWRTKHRRRKRPCFTCGMPTAGPMPLPKPQIAIEDLVPLIPANAYRPVAVGGQTSWCVTLGSHPQPGKVRIVVSFANQGVTGNSVRPVTNRATGAPPRSSACIWNAGRRKPLSGPQGAVGLQ